MPASASPSRRFFPPRFSLRALLVAVTAFAIGFPIWYRWPYEEEDPALAMIGLRQVTTWQRQWGGKRLKYGLERRYAKGKLVMQTSYRNGQLHGPHEA